MIVMERFDLEKFCNHVQDFGITYAFVAPPVVLALGKHPAVDKYDLSSLRMISSGAAPLTRELTEIASSRIKVGIK